MSFEDALIKKYAAYTVEKGGETLLRVEQASAFIDDCQKQGVAIIGMDFFMEKNGGIVEIVGHSADFSRLEGAPDASSRSASAARAVVAGGLPNGVSYVSFVLSEP